MKNKTHLLAAMLLMSGISATIAQVPPGAPGAPAPLISPEEQKALVAAVQKARSSDSVKALFDQQKELNKKIDDAMSASVVAADPSLAPVIERLKAARLAHQAPAPQGAPAPGLRQGPPSPAAPAARQKPASR